MMTEEEQQRLNDRRGEQSAAADRAVRATLTEPFFITAPEKYMLSVEKSVWGTGGLSIASYEWGQFQSEINITDEEAKVLAAWIQENVK